MNELEFTYRTALRWYPKKWRIANAEAVVGILLDAAESDDRTEPARGELANLYRNGLAARLSFVSRVLDHAARQRASILTLGLGTSISVAGILFASWTYQFANRGYQQVFSLAALLQNLGSGQGVYLFWVAAFVATLLGFRWSARAILLASIPVSIVWTLIALALSDYGHPSSVSLGFLDLLAIVAASGLSSHRPHNRKELLSIAVGFGVLLAGAFWLHGYGGGYWGNGALNIDYFWAPLAVWLVFAGIPLALLVALVVSKLKRPSLASGILFAGSPLLYLGLFSFANRNDTMGFSAIVVVIMVTTAIAVGVLRLFGLRIQITRA